MTKGLFDLRSRFVLAVLPISLASNQTLAQPAVPQWKVTPQLRVDGNDADLARPTFLLVDSKGTIYVGEASDNTIVMFDSRGKRAGTIGRRGSGPGEFRSVWKAGFVGDSLWTYDAGMRRTTVFTPSHKFARSVLLTLLKRIPGDSTTPKYLQNPETRAVYPDGSLLMMPSETFPKAGGSAPGFSLVRVTSVDSTIAIADRVVMRLPRNDGLVLKWSSDTTNFGVTVPFYPVALHAVSRDGRRIATLITSIGNNGSGTYVVAVVDEKGSPVAHHEFAFTGTPLSKAAADSEIARRSKDMQPEYRALLESEARKRIPLVYPPVSSLQYGRDGTLWLRLKSQSKEATWLVLDQTLNPKGRIGFPREFIMHQVDSSNAWGLVYDRDGIPSIVRYGITASSP